MQRKVESVFELYALALAVGQGFAQRYHRAARPCTSAARCCMNSGGQSGLPRNNNSGMSAATAFRQPPSASDTIGADPTQTGLKQCV